LGSAALAVRAIAPPNAETAACVHYNDIGERMIYLDALQNLVDRQMSRTLRISVLNELSAVTRLCNQFMIQS
jgi:hypothetical protein